MQRKVSIGIVENQDLWREDLREKLSQGEHVSVLWEAPDGPRALRTLGQNRVPQVLLMDVALPGMDGIETTWRARRMIPDLKIVLLTGADEDQHLFPALRAGATGYLRKDLKAHRLLQALEEVQEGGMPLSPALARLILPILRGERPLPAAAGGVPGLTRQEQKVLECLKEGKAVKQMADQLFIAENTVRKHLEHIYRKLRVHSATQAVAVAQGYQTAEREAVGPRRHFT